MLFKPGYVAPFVEFEACKMESSYVFKSHMLVHSHAVGVGICDACVHIHHVLQSEDLLQRGIEPSADAAPLMLHVFGPRSRQKICSVYRGERQESPV